MKRVRKVLRSLNQTRESLSVEESFLEQPGQLLDKALTKQIAIREAELDSLVAPKKKNVSVIVRCSTPDPETKCSKDNPASHFPDPDKVPEDFSFPLNYFLESSENLENPPLPPHHPAPGVPWTPPRLSHSVRALGETSLLDGFRSPRTSALLKPLINLKPKESSSEMADLTPVKNECEKKIRLFKSLLRRHDPTGMDPGDVQENHKSWNDEISNALTSLEESVGNMIIDHRAAMSADAISHWEQQVVESEKR